MNVTSLIDVLLVLMIVFMVLPHQRGERAEIPQPSAKHPITPPNDPIVIELVASRNGKPPLVRINQEEMGGGTFEKRLTAMVRSRTDTTAFLKVDPEIDFEYAAVVIDTARRAGVDHIGLIGKKQ
jgi:biopolymer transport protein ExbD